MTPADALRAAFPDEGATTWPAAAVADVLGYDPLTVPSIRREQVATRVAGVPLGTGTHSVFHVVAVDVLRHVQGATE
jgi:hypothetical protein